MSKFDSFTKTGKYHLNNEIDNQDAYSTGSNDRFDVVVLADGVSRCERGGEGAEITVETIKKTMLDNGDVIMKADVDDGTNAIMSVLKSALESKARANNEDVKEYASTLSAVLIDRKNKNVFSMNLGDSLIFGIKGMDVAIVGKPADSTYGIPTTVTSCAETIVDSRKLSSENALFKYDSFVLCSDGAWREFFNHSKLRNDVKNMLIKKNYNGLRNFLKERDIQDDCSFVALDTERENEWDKDPGVDDFER
ncbi:MAG: protein phosphatase 2C domain-containing protein [Clostridia bacterium]|nr:protein phosphatase 2C domain-containing protein [Clostridia bacterium]